MGRTTTPPLIANFDPAFIDFNHGIRVGRLEENQRITKIVKHLLIERHGVDMIGDRWGRGVYWQWICWVPRPNREAKPISSAWNFSSAKFFVSVDQEEKEFLAGLQVERAPLRSRDDVTTKKDWDWYVLLKALKGKTLPAAVKRLLSEGFRLRCGPFSDLTEYTSRNFSASKCLSSLDFAGSEWGMFQLSYPFSKADVRGMSGHEVIAAVMGIFDEVTEAMNLCMYAPCLSKIEN